MKTSFGFEHLSRAEREFIEQVLLEEMDFQRWLAVAYSVILAQEIIIPLQ